MSKPDPLAGELNQRALFLEGALSLVSDAVIVADMAGHVAYANSTATTLLGVAVTALEGALLESVLSLIDVVTGETIGDALNETHGGICDSSSRKAVLINGAEIPIIIEYKTSVVAGADGTPIGTAVVFRDIMRRRQAEEALQSREAALIANAAALFQEKERAHVTLNSIADSVVSTDFSGNITFLNNIAETMTGWNQSEALGRQLDEVFYLIDAETRRHVTCSAMLAIIQDRAVEPAEQTVLISRSGKELPISSRASPIHDREGGVVGAVMVAHDVSETRETTKKLTRLALLDTLTGLPNRIVLVDRLHQAIEWAQRHQQMLAVLFIDLDRFKPVNDQFGHAYGDSLLQQVADRLAHCVRGSDTVCRLGGDEFVILLSEIAHLVDPQTCADKVKAALREPFQIRGHAIEIGASIGIATWPKDAMDADALLVAADKAMSEAKASGRTFELGATGP